jgi:hypothetical protein
MSARDVLETNIDPAVPDGGRASIDAYRTEVLAAAGVSLIGIACAPATPTHARNGATK